MQNMQTESLFEYACPECGRGMIRTTRIHNYKTKIKGYPFVVDEALIGVCDECNAESFTPEETQRWEEAFNRSLEARRALLSSQEVSELRTALGLSMEDFARLIGSTRQSISMWEKKNRTSPPLRVADLLMKLLRQSLHAGPVDVLTFLLEEAKKWGVVIELRRPFVQLTQNEGLTLQVRKLNRGDSQKVTPLALAAENSEIQEQTVVVDSGGKQVGMLYYDFSHGNLVIDVSSQLPNWKAADAEIKTQDGKVLLRQAVSIKDRAVVLPDTTDLRAEDVDKITLKPTNK